MKAIWRGVLVAVVVTVSAGCGDDTGATVPPSPMPPPPPNVVIRAGERSFEVGPHGFHTPNAVADGTTLPANGPAVVIDSSDVVIEYPLPGWTFTAALTVAGEPHGSRQPVTVEPLADGRFRLVPPADVNTYDVWLEGDGDGSAGSFVFRWRIGAGPTASRSGVVVLAWPAPPPSPPGATTTVTGLAALISGTVVIDPVGHCVMLGNGELRLVVWPAGTSVTPAGDAVVLPDGRTVKDGETVRGGGGIYSIEQHAELAPLLATLPKECPASRGEADVFNSSMFMSQIEVL